MEEKLHFCRSKNAIFQGFAISPVVYVYEPQRHNECRQKKIGQDISEEFGYKHCDTKIFVSRLEF